MVIGANVDIGASQATGDLLDVSWGGALEPSIEVFIFRSVSLGTTLGVSYARSKDHGSAVAYGVTPRIGYALPFVLFEFRLGEADDHHLRRILETAILESRNLALQIGFYLCTNSWIAEIREQLAVGRVFRRDTTGESVCTGDVQIHIGLHVLTCRAR